MKKKNLLNKLKQKKETKPEKLKRMENEKEKAGKLAMRSKLWRHRREKDGKLVEIWRQAKETLDRDLAENEDDDPWIEDIILTDEERRNLQQLEFWYVPHNPPINSRQEQSQAVAEPQMSRPNLDCEQRLESDDRSAHPRPGKTATETSPPNHSDIPHHLKFPLPCTSPPGDVLPAPFY